LNLGEKLRNAIELLRKATILDKDKIREAIKEIQRALIAADVEVNLVLNLTKKIEEEAFKEPPKGLSRKEHVIKVTYDLLAELLGKNKQVNIEKPKRILLVGLFGSGKTTTAAKLSKFYKKRGFNPLLVCADTFRPAAFDQLKQLSEQANIKFFGLKEEKNPVKIIEKALNEFNGVQPIIVDSAGRNALDEELALELKEIRKAFKADETWLVLSADIGHTSKIQAKAFNDLIGITGVILTKMDGSAKGGGALAACAETNAKVIFIGTGEKIDDLQLFDAERFLSRMLGYGDIQSLLEKAAEISSEEMINPEELLEGNFNLNVFYKQIEAAKKLGPLNKVAEMLGFGFQIPKEQLDLGETKLHSFKVIMDSMTKQEKNNPEIINSSRIKRIAKGSGKTELEVRELLKHYKKTAKLFDSFKKLKLPKKESLNEKEIQKLLQKVSGKKAKKLRLK